MGRSSCRSRAQNKAEASEAACKRLESGQEPIIAIVATVSNASSQGDIPSGGCGNLNEEKHAILVNSPAMMEPNEDVDEKQMEKEHVNDSISSETCVRVGLDALSGGTVRVSVLSCSSESDAISGKEDSLSTVTDIPHDEPGCKAVIITSSSVESYALDRALMDQEIDITTTDETSRTEIVQELGMTHDEESITKTVREVGVAGKPLKESLSDPFPVSEKGEELPLGKDYSGGLGLAASLLMEKIEGSEPGESKERFRQRLWCYLFENLNRAIDELYFLCELECDMEQIDETLLVLEEASLDFTDLKSRAVDFDKAKKPRSLTRMLATEGTVGSSLSAKVEHQRPHAISWEVRRMACSPRRAEILSSSLEVFKKVQENGNESVRQKRRNATHLLSSAHGSKEDCYGSNAKGLLKSKAKENPSVVNSTEPVNRSFTNADRKKADASQVSKIPDSAHNLANFNSALVSSKNANNGVKHALETVPIKGGKEKDTLRASLNGIVTCPQNSETPGSTCEFLYVGEVSLKMPMDMEEKPLKHRAIALPEVEKSNKSLDSSERRVSISDNEKDKKPVKSRRSLDAWKEKRNWEDILSSPLRGSSRASRSPGGRRKSIERARVLHDKLMSPERRRKNPSETKKEVDEKQARATRIRRELEHERAQRLQKTTEKLNRVSEWQAVRSTKLRENMNARQQRGESRHEAYLAQIARRASDESCKVSEVRFITSLNEENKKLSLQQKLQDSELRRAERLQIMKSKQKEDVAREEAVLERKRLLEAERLQRITETQRRKEEAKARREEERKAASAAREAKAVEQVRKKEVRAKAQQEEAKVLKQKLVEKLQESELRRRVYLEQIRERASMELRDQSSPSTRRPLSRDGNLRIGITLVGNEQINEVDVSSMLKAENHGTTNLLQNQAMKRRIKKIRQKLMAKKYEFIEPPLGPEGSGIGSISAAGVARSKIGRWLQDLQRLQQARKAGNAGVGLIIGEMIKYLDGKEAELHAARQAGLLDFIATALPASHTSKPEVSQRTNSFLHTLRVLLSLAANRSYFIARNLLPPLIPMLVTALENFSTLGSIRGIGNNALGFSIDEQSLGDKLEALGEVLEGLLWCITSIIGHTCSDARQLQMKDDLVELIVASEVIHRLRDLLSLFDRPQIEGAPFPTPVLLGLNLLQTLTDPRGKLFASDYDHTNIEMQLAELRRDTLISPSETLSPIPENSDLKEENQQDHMVTSNMLVGKKDSEYDSFSLTLKPEVKDGSLEASDEREKLLDVSEIEGSAQVKRMKVEENEPSVVNSEHLNSDEIKAVDASTKGEKTQSQKANAYTFRSTKYLLAAVAETGLVGLPSLLTAVLLQTNPRSTIEQAASALPADFEEVATCVLKVLNSVARLDLALVQRLLAMPDLQMEFFHLASFLLSHCTFKWRSSVDQVASLLFETLLLLGYFALLHPGNQAVLRWGKSPTILHKICDLPFAFFSDPLLTPILVGTLLAACYGSERNRDVVQQELSMELLLSLFKTSKEEEVSASALLLVSNSKHSKGSQDLPQQAEGQLGIEVHQMDLPAFEESEEVLIQSKEEAVLDEGKQSLETEAMASARRGQRVSGLKNPLPDSISKKTGRGISKTPSSSLTIPLEVEPSKDSPSGRTASSNKGSVRNSNAVGSSETQSNQARKKGGAGVPSVVEGRGSNSGLGNFPTKRVGNIPQDSALGGTANGPPSVADTVNSKEGRNASSLPAEFVLRNRFPVSLLDAAQEFFAAAI